MVDKKENEVNKPGTPVTKEDKEAFKPLTKKEQELAVEKAFKAETEALEAKKAEMFEALKTANPAELSDHVRSELGMEERPVKKEENDA